MVFGDRQVVCFESSDVGLDGFADVGEGGLLVFALRDTTGEAGTLGDPEAVFAAMEEDLPHEFSVADLGRDGSLGG